MRTVALFVGTCRDKKPILGMSGFVKATDTSTFIHKHSVSHTSQSNSGRGASRAPRAWSSKSESDNLVQPRPGM
jgi:hypothetical protein